MTRKGRADVTDGRHCQDMQTEGKGYRSGLWVMTPQGIGGADCTFTRGSAEVEAPSVRFPFASFAGRCCRNTLAT